MIQLVITLFFSFNQFSSHKHILIVVPTNSNNFEQNYPENKYHFMPTVINEKQQFPPAVKLLIGAGGIYAAFLYYGTLQEEVFHYKASDGSKFTQAWILQAIG